MIIAFTDVQGFVAGGYSTLENVSGDLSETKV